MIEITKAMLDSVAAHIRSKPVHLLFPDTAGNIEKGLCPICKQPIREMRDDISLKEFGISGQCQECQDSFYK